jgi:hypothetical protein
VTAPVRLAAVLAATARPDRCVLVGSDGLWCADCLLPGCTWTTTTANQRGRHDGRSPARPQPPRHHDNGGGCDWEDGMSRRRVWLWNLFLVAVEGAALVFAHCVGVPWSALAAELAGLLLVGVAGFVYVVRVHVPRAHRRFQKRLKASLGARAALMEAEDGVGAAPPRRPALSATTCRSAGASDPEAAA